MRSLCCSLSGFCIGRYSKWSWSGVFSFLLQVSLLLQFKRIIPALRRLRRAGVALTGTTRRWSNWTSRTSQRGEACGGRSGGEWAAQTIERPPHQSAQPPVCQILGPAEGKRPHKEHRPQQPSESIDPTQHATGDCSGPRKETATRQNVTQGVFGGWPGPQIPPPPHLGPLSNCRCRPCRCRTPYSL